MTGADPGSHAFCAVARTQGTLRLVLNTKLWSEMVVEKASDKAIRVSAMEDGIINLYLIMVSYTRPRFSHCSE
jgi:hypothetical protein